MYVLAIAVVLVLGLSGTLPLEAATCTASVATVTKTSSPDFYIDTGLESAYTSFSVATGASGSFSDLWVKVDTFTNTSLLGLAPTEDGLYRVGALASNSTSYVYFYFKGAVTATTQSYTVRLYEGKPGAGGSETCNSSQSNTSVSSTISAAANKVNTVNYTTPTLGGNFTLTIIGDTGTIGNSQIFSYTPATLDSWNADCLELKDTQIVLTGGNTGTYSHDLYRSGLNKAASGYTLTYTFNVKCVTASNTPVTPVNYISSGNDLKHTDTGSGTYAALPPIAPALNYLLLTKTVSPGGSTGGGDVTYSVNIINNGPSSASLDSVKDVLPSSPATVTLKTNTSTYDFDISDATPAASIANPTVSGQTLDWIRTFTIASGKTARITYQATIPSTTGSYVNSAKAFTGTTQIDTTVDTTDNAPATATYGVGNPSMTSSTKTASDLNGGDLQPGDTIEYTITATATGSNNATGVQITDTIDSDTDSLSGVVVGANSTNCGNTYINNSTSTALDITNITITANTSCVITFQVKVKSSALDGATVLNTASIVPSNAGAIPGYPSSTPLIVQKNPILGITIAENDADNVVVANQVITYTITIKNTGQTNANGVDLADTIAGPVGSLSAVSLTNCGSTYVDTSSGLSVTIASLSITTSASCVITYTVTVNSGATSGSVTNSADITAAREGGSDPAAVSASTLLIGVVATPPSLATAITENDVDNFVDPGQSVTYTVTITNSGQTDATTSMTSNIPTGFGTPGSISYLNCGSPSSSFSAGTLSFSSISVAAGNTCTIQYTTTVNSPVNEGTTLTVGANVAQASQGGNDPANVNADTLTVDATPILATTIAENDADNQVLPSQDITYTITISNTGDGAATGVSLAGTPTGPIGNPGTFSFTSCGASYTNDSGSSVSIAGLSISAGGTCTITYHVIVDANASSGATITQTADASAATEGGSDPSASSATTLTVASLPNLAVAISENDADNTVTPGQTVTYTVTITNSGGINATTSMALSIPAQMTGPASFTYSSCGTPSGGATVTSITINASQTCTITFTATVATPLNEGTTLTVGANVAQASQGGNDPANVNADTLTVDATPILATTITENDADNQVYPSQDITYTITITNTGDGAATGISIVGASSSSIGSPGSFSFSGCGGSYTNNSTTTVNVSGIAITAAGTCTITYHVIVNSDASGGTITQTVNANAASEGGNDPSLASATTLNIATLPDLDVNIADSDADNYVTPGQVVTYTVTIINNGQTNATTSMALSIPAQMTGPASFTYSSCGTPSGGATVTSITINASQTCTITFTATVATPLNEGTTLTVGANVAQASQGGNDPANVNADTLTVDATPNLSSTTYAIADDNGGTLQPGDIVNYTLTIKNTGDGAATGVNVSGAINANATLNTDSFNYSNCGSSPSSSSDTNTLTLQNIDIAVGTDCVISFNVTLKSPINEGTQITETATVNGADEGGVGASVTSNTLTTDATPNMSTSYIELQDVDGGSAKPGDKIAYTIHVINSGNGDGSGINLTSALSPYLNVVIGSFSFENCGESYGNSSTSSALNISNLAVTTTTECTIYFEAFLETPLDEGTEVYFTSTIGSAIEGGPGAAPSSEKLIIDATPNLGVIIFNDDDDKTVSVGQSVHTHIEIANFGDGEATGVTASYTFNGSIDNFSGISFINCGSGATYEQVSGGYDFKNLEISTTDDCIIQFDFIVNSDAEDNSTIDQSVDTTAANEGGSKPDVATDDTLTVDANNQAPNIPSNVLTSLFSGGNYVNATALTGATANFDLTDPDESDQVRYRIQIATDPTFNDVVIDYRSGFGDEGSSMYTYQETSGTYLKGSASSVLYDGPYYVQIRTEDIGGANSAWYKIEGIAFNYDNTPPVKPEKPFTIGDIKDGTMNIGWDTTEEPSPHPTIPYRLVYSDDPSFTTFSVLDTSDVNNIFTSVPLGSYKYFKIIWRDVAGNLSEPSDVLTVYMPKPNEPTPPEEPPTPVGPTNPTPSNPTTLPPTQLPVNQPIDQPVITPEQLSTRLTIYVSGANRLPVKDAKVTLSDGRILYTDEEGVVRFDGLAPGNYNAKVEYKGKVTTVPVSIEKGTKEMFINVSLPYVKSFNKALLWIPAAIPLGYLGWLYRKRHLMALRRTIHRSIFKSM